MMNKRKKFSILICLAIILLFIAVFIEKSRHSVVLAEEISCQAEMATSFRFPIGEKGLRGYYNAQKFGENNHLGEDWNGTGGGNTDLGDPVYAIANGMVTYSTHLFLGWGRVVRICHRINDNNSTKYIESIYAHLDSMEVEVGDKVAIGQKIGTIGTANGRYWAHLHFELRDGLGQNLGAGYSKNTKGYLNPTKFIKKWQKENSSGTE